MSRRYTQKPQSQPYSNMPARRGVLIAGFVLSLAGFALVLTSCLFLFVPSINFVHQVAPTILLKWLLIAGIALAFAGTLFSVAGANTMKSVARLSMFLSTVSFIVGAALLVIVLLFRSVLPLDAIQKLANALPYNF